VSLSGKLVKTAYVMFTGCFQLIYISYLRYLTKTAYNLYEKLFILFYFIFCYGNRLYVRSYAVSCKLSWLSKHSIEVGRIANKAKKIEKSTNTQNWIQCERENVIQDSDNTMDS